MRFIVKDNSHDIIMAVIINNKTRYSFNGDVQNRDCQIKLDHKRQCQSGVIK